MAIIYTIANVVSFNNYEPSHSTLALNFPCPIKYLLSFFSKIPSGIKSLSLSRKPLAAIYLPSHMIMKKHYDDLIRFT